MINVKVLRPTVIDGRDVMPGDKVKVELGVARRLIAMGKVVEVKRGRPRKKDDDRNYDQAVEDAAEGGAAMEDLVDDEAE